MGGNQNAGLDPDEVLRQMMEEGLEREYKALYGDGWREVRKQLEDQRLLGEQERESRAATQRPVTLSKYLARPLAEDESALMFMAYEFHATGLTEEILATANRLSRDISNRRDELEAMPVREQYKHERAMCEMLNLMEGFYLFGGSSRVEKDGIRATHPWGAVLYPIYDVFEGLSKIHSPLLIKKAYEMQVGNVHEAAAVSRWARLDPVREWAFEQRRDDPPPRSRAAVIKRILSEIKDRAKAAGEPLTGDDPAVTRTVTGWFRKAGIR